MKPTSQKAIMAILVAMTVSSTMLVQTVYGATPEPSVLESTVKYVDYSYALPPAYRAPEGISEVTYNVNSTIIEITIKNPPIEDKDDLDFLHYNVRVKDHLEENWTTLYGTEYRSGPLMSDSEYATMTFRSSGDISFRGPQDATIVVPASRKIDIQVAVFKESTETYGDAHIQFSWGYRSVYNLVGSWTDTQTITIPRIPTPTIKPTPSPTPPDLIEVLVSFDWEKITLVVLTVAVAIMAVGMVIMWRRRIPIKQVAR